MRSRRPGAVVLALVLMAGCGSDGASSGDDDEPSASETTAAPTSTAPAGVEPYEGYVSDLYAGPENWLCRPDRDDICDTDLDATAVLADGSTEVIEVEPAADPAVDCFYVYPTISADPGPVADLEPAAGQEVNVALIQASRFSELCRVFAPVYRQVSLNGLGGGATDADRDAAYADVLDAWKQYVAADNGGRGVVLIGHSQGAGHLRRLIEEEVDGVPALQDRLVSALLLGSTVAVPDGEVVGGAFQTVPLCEAADQVGCVISYASFRATAPPPPETFFGTADGDVRAACTNPADLAGGGPAPLTPYFKAAGFDAGDGGEITTEWVTFPDFLTGECRQSEDVDWLEIAIDGDPADPRADDIPGDLTPPWGLHLVDVNVALGDLVDVVRIQIDAYAA